MLAQVPQEDRVGLLGNVPFFAVLDAPARKKLADRAYPRQYEAGETVVGQGDYGHTMFIVVSGSVHIEVTGEQGQAMVVARLDQPGQFFGEVALLGRARRTATVKADSAAVLLELEKTVVEQANKKSKGKVFKSLRKSNTAREVARFLGQHRYFAELDDQTMTYLAGEAHLNSYERDKVIFKEDDSDEEVLLLKTSMAKMVRVREGKGGRQVESILAYYNVGDLIGLKPHASRTREVRMVSMGYTEVIGINRDILVGALKGSYPDLYDRLSQDMRGQIKEQKQFLAKGKTVAIFLGEMLNEGATEGQSLLNINLNKCVRCGNCVKSCHDRHGYARFSRRGKKLMRRRNVEKAGDYESILLPASCRHCVNPECMIGCPTGAIHRKPGGEVDIHDFCIGCASCANRCPWGNIAMVTTPRPRIVPAIVDGEKVDVERPQIAAKCNLCHGYEYSNCVHNCPTGAILRVDPTTYWEEIAEVFRDHTEQRIGGSTVSKKRRIELAHPAMSLLSVLVTVIMLAIWGSQFVTNGGHVSYSWQMITLGLFAFTFFLGATGLAVRRRIKGLKASAGKDDKGAPRFRAFQPGSFLTWTRAHLYLGVLALVATWLHSGFQFGGPVTSMIMILTYLVIATGLFGLIYYKWLPRRITHIEGDSQVEEDLIVESHEIDKRREEFLEGASSTLKAVAGKMRGVGGSVLSRFSLKYDLGKAQEAAWAKFSGKVSSLDDNEQGVARRLLDDAVRLKDIAACHWLYRVRRGWLILHVSVVTCVLTLVFLHVLIVLAYRVS